MKAVVQRVSRASVTVEGAITGQIERGLLVLLGVEHDDGEGETQWLVDKILNLRIFTDDEGKMNRSAQDVDGGLLVVSQFTLLGDCRKGRRPSFVNAAPPELAEQLYERFIQLATGQGGRVEAGRFRADMQVELVNDGPVTLVIETPNF